MDLADHADIQSAGVLDAAIAKARQVKTLEPTGFCFNCREPLANPKALYCDEDCADDHQHRIRRRKDSGYGND